MSLKSLSNKVGKMFTAQGYAKAPFAYKILALITLCACIIIGFGSIIGLDASYRSFSEPSSIPDSSDIVVMSVSILETIIGVLLMSMIIAVFSQAYGEQNKRILEGHFPFTGKKHIVIINYSKKMHFIVDSMNDKYQKEKRIQDIVLLVNEDESTSSIRREVEMFSYANLNIIVKTGDIGSYKFYKNANIEGSSTILVLSSQFEEDRLKMDNNQVKVATTLLSEPAFRLAMRKSLESSHPKKVIFELRCESEHEKIINGMCEENKLPNFTTFNSWKFSSNIISSSIVDNEYLNLFYSMADSEFSQIVVESVAKKYPYVVGKDFKDVVTAVEDGYLMGVISEDEANKFNALNPENKKIKSTDKLIFIKQDRDININRTVFVEKKGVEESDELLKKIQGQLSEYHSRRVLVIGSQDISKYLKENLDKQSANQINVIDELNTSKMMGQIYNELIEHEKYDTILVNLDEESAYSTCMELIYSEQYKHLGFHEKVIVVLKNRDNIVSIERAKNKIAVFNEEAITGLYMAQLAFQPEMSRIYWELVIKEGGELYLISITDEMKSQAMGSMREMKQCFINVGINVLGVVDKNGKVRFGEPDFNNYLNGKKLIVSSKGDV